MANRTATRTVECDSEPIDIYNLLAQAGDIPRWAPVFADTIESIDSAHCVASKNGEAFHLEIVLHPSALAVDYIREMPNNTRGGAYIRVTPRPLSGSVVMMTVPIAPDTNESDIARTVEQELADLIRLAMA